MMKKLGQIKPTKLKTQLKLKFQILNIDTHFREIPN